MRPNTIVGLAKKHYPDDDKLTGFGAPHDILRSVFARRQPYSPDNVVDTLTRHGLAAVRER
jgi:hypothetical protein